MKNLEAGKIDKIINDKLETSIIDMIIDSKKDINIKTINDKKSIGMILFIIFITNRYLKFILVMLQLLW